MATHWTLGCDADDPQRIAAFWALALRYVPEPGFDGPDSASIVDPEGRGPAIGFLKVPEGKTAKNRGEGQQLQAEDVDAHRLGGTFVLTDGHPAATDPAVIEPGEDEDDEHQQQQQQEVV